MYADMLHWPVDNQMKYIRGFADGEGTPIMRKGYKKKNGKLYPQWDRKIKISNSDKELLLTVKEMLQNARIDSRLYLDHAAGRGRATIDCWALCILKKDSIARFNEFIGFTQTRKADLMKSIIASYR